MLRMLLVSVVVLLSSEAAHCACQAEIATAMRRASALPASAGRAALLEQIQRADVAHHEDDDDECFAALKEATTVLDSIDAAKARTGDAKSRAVDENKPNDPGAKP